MIIIRLIITIHFLFLFSTGYLLAEDSFLECKKVISRGGWPLLELPLQYAGHFKAALNEKGVLLATSRDLKKWNLLYLSKDGKSSPCAPTVRLPLKRLAAFSSTSIAFLNELGEANLVKAVLLKKHLSKELQEKLPELQELGYPANPELVAKAKVDLALTFFVLDENLEGEKRLKDFLIPLLSVNEFLEPTPLGRAEWIKFFGLLVGKESEAKAIFNQTEKSYLRLKKEAERLNLLPIGLATFSLGSTALPKSDGPLLIILKDAKGGQVWSRTGRTLGDEEVMRDLKKATKVISLNVLKNRREFPLLKDKKIYALKEDESGNVKFFESAFIHPDKILESFIFVLHDDKRYQNSWFEELKH